MSAGVATLNPSRGFFDPQAAVSSAEIDSTRDGVRLASPTSDAGSEAGLSTVREETTGEVRVNLSSTAGGTLSASGLAPSTGESPRSRTYVPSAASAVPFALVAPGAPLPSRHERSGASVAFEAAEAASAANGGAPLHAFINGTKVYQPQQPAPAFRPTDHEGAAPIPRKHARAAKPQPPHAQTLGGSALSEAAAMGTHASAQAAQAAALAATFASASANSRAAAPHVAPGRSFEQQLGGGRISNAGASHERGGGGARGGGGGGGVGGSADSLVRLEQAERARWREGVPRPGDPPPPPLGARGLEAGARAGGAGGGGYAAAQIDYTLPLPPSLGGRQAYGEQEGQAGYGGYAPNGGYAPSNGGYGANGGYAPGSGGYGGHGGYAPSNGGHGGYGGYALGGSGSQHSQSPLASSSSAGSALAERPKLAPPPRPLTPPRLARLERDERAADGDDGAERTLARSRPRGGGGGSAEASAPQYAPARASYARGSATLSPRAARGAGSDGLLPGGSHDWSGRGAARGGGSGGYLATSTSAPTHSAERFAPPRALPAGAAAPRMSAPASETRRAAENRRAADAAAGERAQASLRAEGNGDFSGGFRTLSQLFDLRRARGPAGLARAEPAGAPGEPRLLDAMVTVAIDMLDKFGGAEPTAGSAAWPARPHSHQPHRGQPPRARAGAGALSQPVL